ncbi:serine protease [Pilimelia terevasa]|uniref:Serine protease n=1 Tax=Pilimelia terevasa TaxID=53372 RepID=A0A8J3BL12_9ACTN|nr:serine protease [Pilimelia terevasa]
MAALLSAALAAPAGAAPPPRAPVPVRASGADTAVTLVTGDRVAVAADGRARVRPGPGRAGIAFFTHRSATGTVVVPRDAVPLLAAGRLDPRLFDVTALGAANRARRGDAVRLVLTPARGGALAPRAVPRAAGRTVTPLSAIGGLAVRTDAARAAALWRDLTGARPGRTLAGGVDRVWFDGQRRISLDRSVPQTGAPAAWQAGYEGAGVKVAVLDTGVDTTHPDLAGRVVAARGFGDAGDPAEDHVGHGTHVAATVGGSGAAAGGTRRGMAPRAGLLNGKVCSSEQCDESAILEGMAWAVAEGARVVNISIGATDAPGIDPLEQAVEDLSARHGTLFVVSAGNDGEARTVNSPATADSALAVAAVDRAGVVTDFSSRGLRDDGAVKPEIAAPGLEITAARSSLSPDGEGPYLTLSGTSMASPHVAGAAALLAGQHPDWTGAQLKAALVGYAAPGTRDPVAAQGAGQVDVAAATGAAVLATTATVNFPAQAWPHGDDRPVTRALTYHNGTAAPVTLALRWEMTGPDGRAAPRGMFTTAGGAVTVPAGATAAVPLTADTAVAGPDGDYAGVVTATAPGLRLRTPVGILRDVERYAVRLEARDRAGAPAYGVAALTDKAGETVVAYSSPGDRGPHVQLPRGQYAVTATSGGDQEQRDAAWFVHPSLDPARTPVLHLDARAAAPVQVTVPRPEAEELGVVMAPTFTDRPEQVYAELTHPTAELGGPAYAAQLGPKIRYPFLRTLVHTVRSTPENTERPFGYQLAWGVRDSFPTGFRRTVREADLATVTSDVAHTGPAGGYQSTQVAWGPIEVAAGYARRRPRPVVETVYHLSGQPDLTWQSVVVDGWAPDEPQSLTEGAPTRYEAGRAYGEQWGRGVYGPAVTGEFGPVQVQDGSMLVMPYLFFDGAGRSAYSTHYGTTAVRRDGVLLGEADDTFAEVPVPAGPARYQVDVTAHRPDFEVSTEERVRWTFALTPGTGPDARVAGPASAVRFSPPLDARNATPAGRTIDVPVVVTHQAPESRVQAVAAQISYDDGATWTDLRLTGSGGRYAYTTANPAAAGFASLRATVTDRAGNTTEQTILRAYRIG